MRKVFAHSTKWQSMRMFPPFLSEKGGCAFGTNSYRYSPIALFAMSGLRDHSSHAGISFILFHHKRTVFTITDTITVPCENHSQLVGAKRVPASRGGQVFRVKQQTLFDILDSPERGLTN